MREQTETKKGNQNRKGEKQEKIKGENAEGKEM